MLKYVPLAIKYAELDRAGRHVVWSKFLKLAGCELPSSQSQSEEEEGARKLNQDDVHELAAKPFNGKCFSYRRRAFEI